MPDPRPADFGKIVSWSSFAVIAFVAIIQGAWWISADQITRNGGYADGDSFTRILRVERLIMTLDWFDITIPDANAPYGTTVHWTRLFDLVLLAISAPMIPFMGFTKALFWAGTIVSPLLHMLTAAAIAWALTPLVGRVAACIAGGLSAAQAGVMVFGIVGRADHHMMFALLIALTLGYLFRALLTDNTTPRYGFKAGLVIACGIWVGPEFLLFMALCLTTMGFHWMFNPSKKSLQINQNVTAGIALGLIISSLIERGLLGLNAVEYDRISSVHVVMGTLFFAFWSALTYLQMNKPDTSFTLRSLWGVCGLIVCAAVMIILFPKIIGNPLNDADLAIQPVYAHISEYKPITDWGRLLIYFGSAFFALPWVLWRLKATLKTPAFWAWLLIGVSLVVFTSLGITWIRWCLYAGMFLAIVTADMIFHMDQYISRTYIFPKRFLIKIIAIPMVVTGPLILGATLLYTSKSPEQHLADKQISCPIKDLSAFLNTPPMNTQNHIIAASANFGPELIYRTDHKAVATVHHRNVSGILDGNSIYRAIDDAQALEIIKARQISLLLICPGSGDDKYFLTKSPDGTLYKRLEKSEIPNWLNSVSLPKTLSKNFKLFAVK